MTMEQWWLPDDDWDLCNLGRSPDEIFGSLLDCSPPSSVPELTIEDYDELDKLLNEHSPCSTTTGSNVDESVISPSPSTSNDELLHDRRSSDKLGQEVEVKDLCAVTPPTATVKFEICESIAPALSQPTPKEAYMELPKLTESEAEATDATMISPLAADSHIGENKNTLEATDFSEDTPFTPSPSDGYVTPPWSPESFVALSSLTDRNGGDRVTKMKRTQSEGSSILYFCQFCGREFKHKIGLKNHERSHVRGETHMCGYCGKTFRYKNKLRRHVNVHARQLRICRFCGQVQSNDYELVQHEKKHKQDGKKVSDLKFVPSNVQNGFDGGLLSKERTDSGDITPYSNQPWSSLCMAFLRTQPYPKHHTRLHSV